MRIFFIFLFLFFANNYFAQRMKVLTRLDAELNESSGLLVFTDSTWLTINDSGNPAVLYEINNRGKVVSRTTFANVNNFDWEELQMDHHGNIYIGDIGNNKQSRNGLTIYKFHKSKIGQIDVHTEAIDFYYPEQLYFPPKKSERNFDAEAFVVQRDSIFIFTKDWSKPFNGISKIYYVPNKSGRYAATLLRTFQTNNISPYRDAITGACWLGNDILILAYGAIYHIKDVHQLLHTTNFVQSKKYIFKKLKQFEAIAASADGKIYITTEKHRVLGRAKLYLWSGMEKK
jgi:hypothetical protein